MRDNEKIIISNSSSYNFDLPFNLMSKTGDEFDFNSDFYFFNFFYKYVDRIINIDFD